MSVKEKNLGIPVYCTLEFQSPLLHSLHHRVQEQGYCKVWSWFGFLHHIQPNTQTSLRNHSTLHQLEGIIFYLTEKTKGERTVANS